MKMSLLLASALICSRAGASGFDDSIIWLREMGIPSVGVSAEPRSVCSRDFEVGTLYTNPYQIGRLRWNDFYVGKGFASWGIFGRFNSYLLDNLYYRSLFEFGSAVRAIDSLAILASLKQEYENFVGFGVYHRRALDARAALRRNRFTVLAALSDFVLSEDYDPDQNGLKAWGALSYSFSNGNTFAVGVRRFSNSVSRWLFSQDLALSKEVNLTIGYVSRPDLIFGKIILRHGSFLIDFSYHSLSGLSDTVVAGVGYQR